MSGPAGEDAEVRANGGVVGRDGRDGPEVLLVHRPRYDDWSLPKGKLEPGESDEECALREVEEETGRRCTLGTELPSIGYLDDKGRTKRVRYWAMTAIEGTFTPNDEVDEVRWVPAGAARDLLTHPHDADVVDAWAGAGGRG